MNRPRINLLRVTRRLTLLVDHVAFHGMFSVDIAPELAAARLSSTEDIDVGLTARPLGPLERIARVCVAEEELVDEAR